MNFQGIQTTTTPTVAAMTDHARWHFSRYLPLLSYRIWLILLQRGRTPAERTSPLTTGWSSATLTWHQSVSYQPRPSLCAKRLLANW